MSTIRRGLRHYGPDHDKFVLIFIHDLESWTESRLWEFLSKKISNCNEVVHGIVKKHYINMENYFILRVNYNNYTDYMKVIYLITKHLPVKRIKWKITSRIRTFSNVNHNRTRYYSEPSIPISESLLYANPFSNTQYFNLCISWNINGWNSEKPDGLTNFNSIFNPICILSSRSR